MNIDKAERLLIKAIQTTPKTQIWSNEDQNKLLSERGIIINLICQLNTHKETKAYWSRASLQFNGEYNKQIAKKINFQPDIIFHGGQSSYDYQKFVCEAKRYDKIQKPSTIHLLFYDLYKLVSYLNLQKDNVPIGFERVYMIIIGCDKAYILKVFEKLPNVTKRINEEEKSNRSKELENINLGITGIRKYLKDQEKSDHLKFIFVPPNYQEKAKIQIVSLEQLITESSELMSFVNNFNNK